MKILALEREMAGITNEDFKPLLNKEAECVWQLYKNNIIREIYFGTETSCAVIIMECDSKQTAEKYLSELPLVKEKLIEFEIIPLTAYPGFERLFK